MRLIPTLRGSASILVIALSTLALSVVLWVLALGKLLAPEGPPRQRVRALLARVAEGWIGINNGLLALGRNTRWDLELPEGLDREGAYLVISNHQSWVDILVLQRCFNRRLPLLRFFLKKQLIWVPLLGVDWWALDFPFMHRATREQVRRNPKLRGADLESARRACEKFSEVPVSMMAFPEGTRFSEAKRAARGSPYRNLLPPRAGGVGQVLYALGERLDACVDVTIAYPGSSVQAPPTFWKLLCGMVPHITVRARARNIPPALLGAEFRDDLEARGKLEAWLGRIWSEKDALLDELRRPERPPPG
jgi:1-acyl-sn-glycerol-3-phosphate acyltransferase